MSKANPVNTTSRRRFLAIAGGASASAAAATAVAIIPGAVASPQDDSALLKLEEQIFEQHEQASAFNAEISRLSEIWNAESHRLYKEALSSEVQTGTYLTPQERWALVTNMPECIEHNRLCELQEPFYKRMEALIEEMFATPAHTAEGRRAKVTVLLGCITGDDWRCVDAEMEYRDLMVRNLLIEFVGGAPGEMLRDQFA
jgi:hypothetical protein